MNGTNFSIPNDLPTINKLLVDYSERLELFSLSYSGFRHDSLLLVGCRCRSHRNRRHIADGQVASSNAGYEASSSGDRMTLVSLLQS